MDGDSPVDTGAEARRATDPPRVEPPDEGRATARKVRRMAYHMSSRIAWRSPRSIESGGEASTFRPEQQVDRHWRLLARLGDGFSAPDELYYSIFDPAGSPTTVLATATSPKSGKTFPSIWTVKHPNAKIACIASGHDERVHSLPAFQKLLSNAVGWVAR